ncbi:MAG: V-type ATPase subunit [Candidatus Aenigmatarchaeota archaeon]|nr:MAG: V-type ATPase subunit [Candidatus Aenigmarchaeota archaeon]
MKFEIKRRQELKKIRFGDYPYIVTRVKVMKSKLLRNKDYIRMEKMGMNEMIRFLEESEYKVEIDSLSKEYRGMELIELALNENLANIINKLLRISLRKEVKLLIEFYSRKWILNNIKLVLRTRMNKLGEKDLKYGIIPIKPMDYEKCFEMYREEEGKFLETVSEIKNLDMEEFKKLYQADNLVGMENEIDKAFYSQLIDLKNKIRMGEKDPLKQFFDHLVYLMNIKNIILFKKEGTEEGTIRKMMVFEEAGERRDVMRFIRKGRREKMAEFMESLVKSEDMETLMGRLKASEYSALVTKEIEEDASKLESSIDRFLLLHASRLLHRQPLSVSPIFGYLLSKEIEIQNIRLMIHSKAMNLGSEFVSSNIIVPEESMYRVIKNA